VGLAGQAARDQGLGGRGARVIEHGGGVGDNPGLAHADDPGIQGGGGQLQPGLQRPGQVNQVVRGPDRDAQLHGDLVDQAVVPDLRQPTRNLRLEAACGVAPDQLPHHAQLGRSAPGLDGVPPAHHAHCLVVAGLLTAPGRP
jgi:hypothetical protein